MNKRNLEREGEYAAEAERLALLPVADQKAVVKMYSDLASSPLATAACRADAKQHAAALAKHLARLSRRKNPENKV
jgi:hypothetical protein